MSDLPQSPEKMHRDPASRPSCTSPRVWVVSDGKIGDMVQCRSISAMLSSDVCVKRVELRVPYSYFAPWGPLPPSHRPHAPTSPVYVATKEDLPDILVLSGRRAYGYARALAKRAQAFGATVPFVVFLKDPKVRRNDAHFIWAPAHDRLTQASAFATLTSPHDLTALMEKARATPNWLPIVPSKILGAVLGGPGGGAPFGAAEFDALGDQLALAAADYDALAITWSRRTPEAGVAQIKTRLDAAGLNIPVYYDEAKNGYAELLGRAQTNYCHW